MSQMFRQCPECGGERLFQTHHDPGACPDSADGECPEWSCTGCGTALLAGFVLYRAVADFPRGLPGKVA